MSYLAGVGEANSNAGKFSTIPDKLISSCLALTKSEKVGQRTGRCNNTVNFIPCADHGGKGFFHAVLICNIALEASNIDQPGFNVVLLGLIKQGSNEGTFCAIERPYLAPQLNWKQRRSHPALADRGYRAWYSPWMQLLTRYSR
jgi:hypothetical protein